MFSLLIIWNYRINDKIYSVPLNINISTDHRQPNTGRVRQKNLVDHRNRPVLFLIITEHLRASPSNQRMPSCNVDIRLGVARSPTLRPPTPRPSVALCLMHSRPGAQKKATFVYVHVVSVVWRRKSGKDRRHGRRDAIRIMRGHRSRPIATLRRCRWIFMDPFAGKKMLTSFKTLLSVLEMALSRRKIKVAGGRYVVVPTVGWRRTRLCWILFWTFFFL